MEAKSLDILDLDIAPEARYNPPLVADYVRDLCAEDLVVLETTPLGSAPAPLQRLRHVHHQIARMLAAGMKAVEIAAFTSMSQSRISILQNDPAFKELVAFYAEREDERFQSVQDKMVNLGLDAAQILHERLLDDPDSVSNKDLRETIALALDRGGFSPVQKKESLHVTLSAEELKKIKAAVPAAEIRSRENARVQETQGNLLPTLRGDSPDRAVLEAKAAPGSESTGEKV